ncbi:FAD-dependent oxidoreductase [Saccharopolyspora sp. NPDC000359]|uniref:FAD-dependent oxidoreductase n=1 Tax=Saccharopolyspora sp. NPDC000359 TaxID=3154251 RepID=UPI00331AC7BA
MAAGWDEEHDVVVVGSGAGAMAGALVAAKNGLRTAVLEKTDRLGGTSAYSGAASWLPDTAVQDRAGLGDSRAAARTYLRTLVGEATAERQDAFLEHAPALVSLLEADPAIEFEWRPFPDYFAAPGRMERGRSFVPKDLPREQLGDLAALVRPAVHLDRRGADHPDAPLDGGRALIGRLLLAYRAAGGAVRTGTAVDRLVVEGGRVVGVEARTGAGRVRIAARRGVLLAAGGFERSPELRREHGVPGAAEASMAPEGTNTGEVMLAAVEAGAAVDLMDQAWFCPGLVLPDDRSAFVLGLRGGFVVDGAGQRYANESLPYDRMGREMAKAGNRVPSYFVFDSREGGRLPAISLPSAEPAENLAAGTWVRADTLPELAALIDVPADALVATAKRFNEFAETGTDTDFHRGEDAYDRFFTRPHEHPNPALVPLDRPPFHAARLVLSDLGTKGGLRTDPAGRVLGVDGAPLPGLHATGNTAASLARDVYPGPGIPIGTAMVFGYLAVLAMMS